MVGLNETVQSYQVLFCLLRGSDEDPEDINSDNIFNVKC